MSYNNFIKLFPEFNFLEPLFLNNSFSFKKWGRGEFICHSNTDLTDIIFFNSGVGRVYKTLSNGKEVMYATYGSGQIAGDVEFITKKRTTCTLESSDNLSGYVLSTKNLEKTTLLKLYKILSREVANKLILNSTVQAVRLAYSLEERLSFYLLYTYNGSALSMDELSCELAVTYRHLSRVFNKLKNANILKVLDKRVHILDLNYLEKNCVDIKDDLIC